jgi:hypothetical protein
MVFNIEKLRALCLWIELFIMRAAAPVGLDTDLG